MGVKKEDLLEYKQEVEAAKTAILKAKDEGLEAIEKKVEQYREEMVSKYEAEVQKELDKCETESNLIDKLIEKYDNEEELL